jgi:glycerol-3-phosphate dehydrogenase
MITKQHKITFSSMTFAQTFTSDRVVDDVIYDVAIIGAGVVGSAIARELSRYALRCVLLEAGSDVGAGTSKANTAIWHTGFDAKPGTLESRLLRRSYELLNDYMPEVGIPVERLGAILVAWTEEQKQALPSLLEQAHQNGVMDVEILSAQQIYEREAYLNEGVLGGLLVPGEGIFCPFTLPFALATQSVVNGVVLKLNFPIQAIASIDTNFYQVSSASGTITTQYIVNCAGLYSDEIDCLMGHQRFKVTPRRGELIVFDKLARSLVNHVILPVPTAISKGVLISPTVYGNVMLGPTSEEVPNKYNTETTEAGLRSLLQKGEQILPSLLQEEVTATYAGLRAATEFSDYQIHADPAQQYICVGGIRSTGSSACLGIAEYVTELLRELGLPLIEKDEFHSVHLPNIGEAGIRAYQCDRQIQQNSDYGRIVCHCERVTRGELIDALNATIPATTLDGLRRRTRALQGRCQGFNCHANVAALLAEATHQSLAQVLMLEETHVC